MTQSQALATRQPSVGMDLTSLGAVLVKSGYFADTREQAQAIVKVLAGAELGFGPIASMQGVYIVKGRVTLSANLVGAAIQRSGKYRYRVTKMEADACTITFFEGSERIGDSTFTLDDAQKAGLTANDPWKKFPRNMLFSRALTNGARWYCPEVFNGPIYTPDELGADVDEEGNAVADVQPVPARTVDHQTGVILEGEVREVVVDRTQPAPQEQPQDEGGEDEPGSLKCEDCGHSLKETKFKDGTVWGPEALAGYGRRKHGRQLCMTCYRKANDARAAAVLSA